VAEVKKTVTTEAVVDDLVVWLVGGTIRPNNRTNSHIWVAEERDNNNPEKNRNNAKGKFLAVGGTVSAHRIGAVRIIICLSIFTMRKQQHERNYY
jgi:hypothetical protein